MVLRSVAFIPWDEGVEAAVPYGGSMTSSSAAPPWRRFMPMPLDAGLSIVVGALGTAHPPEPATAVAMSVNTVAVVVCAVGIAWRRRFPLAAVALIGVGLSVSVAVSEQITIVAVPAALIAAWTIGARVDPPWRWPLYGWLFLGCAVAIGRIVPLNDDTTTVIQVFILVVWSWGILSAAALAGARRRTIRGRIELAEERAALLAAQQETAARLAVAQDRARVAREVHDLLGHTLTAIAAQAEGAKYVLYSQPERAEEALTTIAEVSRTGVEDVRALVDLLRDDSTGALSPQPPDGGTGTPTPALSPVAPPVTRTASSLIAQICDIAAAVSPAVEVEVQCSQSPHPSMAVVDAILGVEREALTNALRHGAGGARVRVSSTGEHLSLSVTNPIVPDASTCASPDEDGERTGVGIESMRMRARSIGARATVGPASDTTWAVTMEAPL